VSILQEDGGLDDQVAIPGGWDWKSVPMGGWICREIPITSKENLLKTSAAENKNYRIINEKIYRQRAN